MVQVLSKINSGDLVAILICAILFGTAGIITLSGAIILAVRRYYERAQVAAVVSDLLDRGVPPQDVAALLKAMDMDAPAERRARRIREKFEAIGGAFHGTSR